MRQNDFYMFLVCVGAFLIPYILFAVTCGVPLLVLDICIGQYTKQSPVKFWGRLCPLAEGNEFFAFFHLFCKDTGRIINNRIYSNWQ